MYIKPFIVFQVAGFERWQSIIVVDRRILEQTIKKAIVENLGRDFSKPTWKKIFLNNLQSRLIRME